MISRQPLTATPEQARDRGRPRIPPSAVDRKTDGRLRQASPFHRYRPHRATTNPRLVRRQRTAEQESVVTIVALKSVPLGWTTGWTLTRRGLRRRATEAPR